MGMGERNTKKIWKLLFLWLLLVLAMMMIVFSSCTGDMRVDNILLAEPISIDEHFKCGDGHYIDPYTKLEYCLPEGFTNMKNLHLYRVVK